MKVGIDISSLVYERGVSRYTSNLVRALVKNTDLNLSLYGSSFRQFSELDQQAKALCKGSKCRVVVQKLPPSLLRWMWRFSFNSINTKLPKINVFHSWDWQQPPDKNIPLVSTIHDLAILKFPQIAHPQVVRMHHKSWQILKQRKAHIIAVSRSTKQDLVKMLGFDPNLISVIYEALPVETPQTAELMNDEEYDQIKKRLNLSKPYLLFVGTREPRKNLTNLIKAWKPLAKDYQLIVAGEEGGDETSKLAKNKKDSLRFLGKVSHQELVVLYSEANVFVFPSLYEGFGLPILESFYHGTPVVTSNVSSMPEVAGNAAELVEPKSVESIRQGIEKILNENRDAQRKRLQKMIIRLQMFNWQKVARQTEQVYKKTLVVS